MAGGIGAGRYRPLACGCFAPADAERMKRTIVAVSRQRVAMRDETLRLRPVCYVNYHSYLFPAPHVVFFEKQDGMRILDSLMIVDSAKKKLLPSVLPAR